MKNVSYSLYATSIVVILCNSLNGAERRTAPESIYYGPGEKKALTNLKEFFEEPGTNKDQFFNGKTPLMLSVEWKRRQLARYIVSAKASIDIKDSSGKTALDHADQFGHKEIAWDLIDAGAKDLKHRKAFMQAFEQNQKAKMQMLILFNADPNMETASGSRPLIEAAKKVMIRWFFFYLSKKLLPICKIRVKIARL